MKPIQLTSLEQAVCITEKLLAKRGYPPFAFIGQRASDAIMLQSLVPFGTIISLDYGKDAETLSESASVFSLEKRENVRTASYSGNLGKLFEQEDLTREIAKALPPDSLVLPYSSSPLLERFACDRRWILLNNRAVLRDVFEDKISLFRLKNDLSLPNPSVLIDLPTSTFYSLAKQVGLPFILQFARGSSGTGTFVINTDDDFELCRALEVPCTDPVIVTPFISGPTLSINGVITQRQVILLSPGVQVINNPETATKSTTFSGVDFSLMRRLSLKQCKLFALAERVGAFMKSTGFLGAFNLNVMANGLVLTDINPRFMGSGQFVSELQIVRGEIPLSLLHLMSFLGIDFEVSPSLLELMREPREASFVVLHNLEKDIRCVCGDVRPGFYSLTTPRPLEQPLLTFLRPGIAAQYLGQLEVLISGAIPQQGKYIEPGAPLLRIFTLGGVLDSSAFSLTRTWKGVCTSIYRSLDLKSTPSRVRGELHTARSSL